MKTLLALVSSVAVSFSLSLQNHQRYFIARSQLGDGENEGFRDIGVNKEFLTFTGCSFNYAQVIPSGDQYTLGQLKSDDAECAQDVPLRNLLSRTQSIEFRASDTIFYDDQNNELLAIQQLRQE